MSTILSSITPYIQQSYQAAGIDAAAWQPEKGFKANQAIMYQVYDYYQALYCREPERFLWAGLARLTGGQVLYGMQHLIKIACDPCVLTQEIIAVAKAIFEGIAWQHELFTTDKDKLFRICEQLDALQEAPNSFARCWQLAASDNADDIAMGNQLLLQNEQQATIQPHYNLIKEDAYSARYFWFTRFVMRNIHPHHRRFIFHQPFGDVTQFEHRWRWLTGTNGMWPTWCALSCEERDRLVGLDMGNLIRHRW